MTNLQCGKEYSTNIKAISGPYHSGWTESHFEPTDWCGSETSYPRQPTNFRVVGETQSTITYAWEDNSSYEDYYKINWFVTAIGGHQTIVQFPANSETGTIVGLSCGTRYSAVVSGYIDNGTRSGFWIWHDTDPC